MPKKDPHLQFQKWAQQYGDVYSLILGTKTMIVLSSSRAVKDLLDKKSALYSDRPDLYTGQTLASGGKRMSMMVSKSFIFGSMLRITDIRLELRSTLEGSKSL
jgi:hypothetical protein